MINYCFDNNTIIIYNIIIVIIKLFDKVWADLVKIQNFIHADSPLKL